jgi:hypothetical protein
MLKIWANVHRDFRMVTCVGPDGCWLKMLLCFEKWYDRAGMIYVPEN